jgi:hypothetical protein
VSSDCAPARLPQAPAGTDLALRACPKLGFGLQGWSQGEGAGACTGLHGLTAWRRNGSPWCMEPTAHDSAQAAVACGSLPSQYHAASGGACPPGHPACPPPLLWGTPV